eukprot:SAG11_NODE_731_length_7473_cov_5.500949_2_plen_305_part_00
MAGWSVFSIVLNSHTAPCHTAPRSLSIIRAPPADQTAITWQIRAEVEPCSGSAFAEDAASCVPTFASAIESTAPYGNLSGGFADSDSDGDSSDDGGGMRSWVYSDASTVHGAQPILICVWTLRQYPLLALAQVSGNRYQEILAATALAASRRATAMARGRRRKKRIFFARYGTAGGSTDRCELIEVQGCWLLTIIVWAHTCTAVSIVLSLVLSISTRPPPISPAAAVSVPLIIANLCINGTRYVHPHRSLRCRRARCCSSSRCTTRLRNFSAPQNYSSNLHPWLRYVRVPYLQHHQSREDRIPT